jgi:hypothetical protein
MVVHDGEKFQRRGFRTLFTRIFPSQLTLPVFVTLLSMTGRATAQRRHWSFARGVAPPPSHDAARSDARVMAEQSRDSLCLAPS